MACKSGLVDEEELWKGTTTCIGSVGARQCCGSSPTIPHQPSSSPPPPPPPEFIDISVLEEQRLAPPLLTPEGAIPPPTHCENSNSGEAPCLDPVVDRDKTSSCWPPSVFLPSSEKITQSKAGSPAIDTEDNVSIQAQSISSKFGNRQSTRNASSSSISHEEDSLMALGTVPALDAEDLIKGFGINAISDKVDPPLITGVDANSPNSRGRRGNKSATSKNLSSKQSAKGNREESGKKLKPSVSTELSPAVVSLPVSTSLTKKSDDIASTIPVCSGDSSLEIPSNVSDTDESHLTSGLSPRPHLRNRPTPNSIGDSPPKKAAYSSPRSHVKSSVQVSNPISSSSDNIDDKSKQSLLTNISDKCPATGGVTPKDCDLVIKVSSKSGSNGDSDNINSNESSFSPHCAKNDAKVKKTSEEEICEVLKDESSLKDERKFSDVELSTGDLENNQSESNNIEGVDSDESKCVNNELPSREDVENQLDEDISCKIEEISGAEGDFNLSNCEKESTLPVKVLVNSGCSTESLNIGASSIIRTEPQATSKSMIQVDLEVLAYDSVPSMLDKSPIASLQKAVRKLDPKKGFGTKISSIDVIAEQLGVKNTKKSKFEDQGKDKSKASQKNEVKTGGDPGISLKESYPSSKSLGKLVESQKSIVPSPYQYSKSPSVEVSIKGGPRVPLLEFSGMIPPPSLAHCQMTYLQMPNSALPCSGSLLPHSSSGSPSQTPCCTFTHVSSSPSKDISGNLKHSISKLVEVKYVSGSGAIMTKFVEVPNLPMRNSNSPIKLNFSSEQQSSKEFASQTDFSTLPQQSFTATSRDKRKVKTRDDLLVPSVKKAVANRTDLEVLPITRRVKYSALLPEITVEEAPMNGHFKSNPYIKPSTMSSGGHYIEVAEAPVRCDSISKTDMSQKTDEQRLPASQALLKLPAKSQPPPNSEEIVFNSTDLKVILVQPDSELHSSKKSVGQVAGNEVGSDCLQLVNGEQSKREKIKVGKKRNSLESVCEKLTKLKGEQTRDSSPELTMSLIKKNDPIRLVPELREAPEIVLFPKDSKCGEPVNKEKISRLIKSSKFEHDIGNLSIPLADSPTTVTCQTQTAPKPLESVAYQRRPGRRKKVSLIKNSPKSESSQPAKSSPSDCSKKSTPVSRTGQIFSGSSNEVVVSNRLSTCGGKVVVGLDEDMVRKLPAGLSIVAKDSQPFAEIREEKVLSQLGDSERKAAIDRLKKLGTEVSLEDERSKASNNKSTASQSLQQHTVLVTPTGGDSQSGLEHPAAIDLLEAAAINHLPGITSPVLTALGHSELKSQSVASNGASDACTVSKQPVSHNAPVTKASRVDKTSKRNPKSITGAVKSTNQSQTGSQTTTSSTDDNHELTLSIDGTFVFKADAFANHDGSWACDICTAVYSHANALKKHYLRLHVARKCISQKDLDMFNIDSELYETVGNLRCHVCRVGFSSKSSLRNHLDNHPPPPRGRPPMSASLENPSATVVQHRQYACPNCKQVFKWRKPFSKHRKLCKASPALATAGKSVPIQQRHLQKSASVSILSSTKNFQTISPPTASDLDSLSSGSISASGENGSSSSGKPTHHCLYCNETFRTAYRKKNHILSQHPYTRRKHSCVFCNKTILSNNMALFIHLVEEHSNVYFGCKTCKERYVSAAELENHLKKTHPDEERSINTSIAPPASADGTNSSETSNASEYHQCDKCERTFLFENSLKQHECTGSVDYSKDKLPKEKKAAAAALVKPAITERTRIAGPSGDFYSRISTNVRDNLTYYLDGKIDPSTSPVPPPPPPVIHRTILNFSAVVPPMSMSISSQHLSGSAGESDAGKSADTQLTCITPTSSLMVSNESVQQPKTPSWEKFNFPKEYDGRCGLTSYIKDTSHLDLSTQLIMRRNLQRLNLLKEDSPESKDDVPGVLALERLAAQTAESYGMKTSVPPVKGNSSETERESKSDETNVRLNDDPLSESGILSGEWVRDHTYVCSVCRWESMCLWTMEDHKFAAHPHVWAPHHEIRGPNHQTVIPKVYRRLIHDELLAVPPPPPSRREKHECSKCGKSDIRSQRDLHRHVVECAGEDLTQLEATFLAVTAGVSSSRSGRRKPRWRGGSRRTRQGLKRNIPSTPPSHGNQQKKLKKLMRTKPGDSETIEKMIANLPAKRVTRRVLGFDEVDIKTRSQSTIQNVGIIPMLKKPSPQGMKGIGQMKQGNSSKSCSHNSLSSNGGTAGRSTPAIDTSAERGDVLSSLRMMPVKKKSLPDEDVPPTLDIPPPPAPSDVPSDIPVLSPATFGTETYSSPSESVKQNQSSEPAVVSSSTVTKSSQEETCDISILKGAIKYDTTATVLKVSSVPVTSDSGSASSVISETSERKKKSLSDSEKRKRGRPFGSKNKPKSSDVIKKGTITKWLVKPKKVNSKLNKTSQTVFKSKFKGVKTVSKHESSTIVKSSKPQVTDQKAMGESNKTPPVVEIKVESPLSNDGKRIISSVEISVSENNQSLIGSRVKKEGSVQTAPAADTDTKKDAVPADYGKKNCKRKLITVPLPSQARRTRRNQVLTGNSSRLTRSGGDTKNRIKRDLNAGENHSGDSGESPKSKKRKCKASGEEIKVGKQTAGDCVSGKSKQPVTDVRGPRKSGRQEIQRAKAKKETPKSKDDKIQIEAEDKEVSPKGNLGRVTVKTESEKGKEEEKLKSITPDKKTKDNQEDKKRLSEEGVKGKKKKKVSSNDDAMNVEVDNNDAGKKSENDNGDDKPLKSSEVERPIRKISEPRKKKTTNAEAKKKIVEEKSSSVDGDAKKKASNSDIKLESKSKLIDEEKSIGDEVLLRCKESDNMNPTEVHEEFTLDPDIVMCDKEDEANSNMDKLEEAKEVEEISSEDNVSTSNRKTLSTGSIKKHLTNKAKKRPLVSKKLLKKRKAKSASKSVTSGIREVVQMGGGMKWEVESINKLKDDEEDASAVSKNDVTSTSTSVLPPAPLVHPISFISGSGAEVAVNSLPPIPTGSSDWGTNRHLRPIVTSSLLYPVQLQPTASSVISSSAMGGPVHSYQHATPALSATVPSVQSGPIMNISQHQGSSSSSPLWRDSSSTTPSLGTILDSVNNLLSEPDLMYSSSLGLPQYSLADLQKAMGASDAEMAVLQQLGEASLHLSKNDMSGDASRNNVSHAGYSAITGPSAVACEGNTIIKPDEEEEWPELMDLDRQPTPAPPPPPQQAPLPAVTDSNESHENKSWFSNGGNYASTASSHSSQSGNSYQQSSSFVNPSSNTSQTNSKDFASSLRQRLSGSHCASTCGSGNNANSLLAALPGKEVVCPTCSSHFMGFPALQRHINRMHASGSAASSSPTPSDYSDCTSNGVKEKNRRLSTSSTSSSSSKPADGGVGVLNARVVLESAKESRLVCHSCQQILPANLMVGHLSAEHSLPSTDISKCSTISSSHGSPYESGDTSSVGGERLKSKMSSALGDLLERAVNNLLSAKDGNNRMSSGAIQLLNRLCALRKREGASQHRLHPSAKEMLFKLNVKNKQEALSSLGHSPKSKGPPKSFQCGICGAKFAWESSWSQHVINSHTKQAGVLLATSNMTSLAAASPSSVGSAGSLPAAASSTLASSSASGMSPSSTTRCLSPAAMSTTSTASSNVSSITGTRTRSRSNLLMQNQKGLQGGGAVESMKSSMSEVDPDDPPAVIDWQSVANDSCGDEDSMSACAVAGVSASVDSDSSNQDPFSTSRESTCSAAPSLTPICSDCGLGFNSITDLMSHRSEYHTPGRLPPLQIVSDPFSDTKVESPPPPRTRGSRGGRGGRGGSVRGGSSGGRRSSGGRISTRKSERRGSVRLTHMGEESVREKAEAALRELNLCRKAKGGIIIGSHSMATMPTDAQRQAFAQQNQGSMHSGDGSSSPQVRWTSALTFSPRSNVPSQNQPSQQPDTTVYDFHEENPLP